MGRWDSHGRWHGIRAAISVLLGACAGALTNLSTQTPNLATRHRHPRDRASVGWLGVAGRTFALWADTEGGCRFGERVWGRGGRS